MVVDSYAEGYTLIILGGFSATTGNDKDEYESNVGPRGSGSRNKNSSMLIDFARVGG